MFGFTTIVVGNMPNTKLAAAITAAKEQDGNKVDHTEIVRVYEWAWLGDWIKQILSLKEDLSSGSDVSFEQLTAEYPVASYINDAGEVVTYPVIAGANQAEVFHLGVGYALEGDAEGDVTRKHCAYVATHSLVTDDDDECKLVYAVILTEATYAKQSSLIMLEELVDWQGSWNDGPLKFKIRVFVVKDDGSVEMHKL